MKPDRWEIGYPVKSNVREVPSGSVYWSRMYKTIGDSEGSFTRSVVPPVPNRICDRCVCDASPCNICIHDRGGRSISKPFAQKVKKSRRGRNRRRKATPTPPMHYQICVSCGTGFFPSKQYDDPLDSEAMQYPLKLPRTAQRATHFIAIRISNSNVLNLVSALQEEVVTKSPKLIGTRMSLNKMHLSLLVLSLTPDMIPRAIMAMKRAVAIFTACRGDYLRRITRREDVEQIKRIVRLERDALISHPLSPNPSVIDNLNYYPLRLHLDRIACFGGSVLFATLGPEQAALITNFHEIVAICFASVGIPIVGPGSHLNKRMDLRGSNTDFKPFMRGPLDDVNYDVNSMSNGPSNPYIFTSLDELIGDDTMPNLGSLMSTAYYAFAGAKKVPEFVRCSDCRNTGPSREAGAKQKFDASAPVFKPTEKFWNAQLMRSLQMLNSTQYVFANDVDIPQWLRIIRMAAVSRPVDELVLHRLVLHPPPSTAMLLASAENEGVIGSSSSRLFSKSHTQRRSSAPPIDMSGQDSDESPPFILESTPMDGHESDDDLFFEGSDQADEDTNGSKIIGDNISLDRNSSKPALPFFDEIVQQEPIGEGFNYDLTDLGMDYIPQVTIMKTSQAGRRAKTVETRRMMRHLRLDLPYFHGAVLKIRDDMEGVTNQTPIRYRSEEPDKVLEYGVSFDLGEDLATSIELLEMSRGDSDGYYRRVGIAPLLNIDPKKLQQTVTRPGVSEPWHLQNHEVNHMNDKSNIDIESALGSLVTPLDVLLSTVRPLNADE